MRTKNENHPTPQVGERKKIHVVGYLEGVVTRVRNDGKIEIDPENVVAEWVVEPYPDIDNHWSGLLEQ